MNRQPTIDWPGDCAGRTDATRTSPFISSAKNRPWKIRRSFTRRMRRVAHAPPVWEGRAAVPPKKGAWGNPNAGLGEILERAVDPVAVHHVLAVHGLEPRD